MKQSAVSSKRTFFLDEALENSLDMEGPRVSCSRRSDATRGMMSLRLFPPVVFALFSPLSESALDRPSRRSEPTRDKSARELLEMKASFLDDLLFIIPSLRSEDIRDIVGAMEWCLELLASLLSDDDSIPVAASALVLREDAALKRFRLDP